LIDYLKKIIFNYFTIISGKAISIAFSFVFTFLITDSFNTENSGIIFVTLSVIQFLVILSKVGQDQLIVKYNSQKVGSEKLNASIVLVVILSLALTILFSTIKLLFTEKINLDISLITILSVTPLSLIWICVGYFRSLGYQFAANFSENGLFYLIFFLLFYSFGKNSNVFLQIFVLSAYVSLFLIIIYARNIGLKCSFQNINMRTALNVGVPIMTSSILSFLIMNIPIYFAGYLGMNSDVTFYSVCIKISLFINLGVAIVNSFYAPKYADAFRHQEFLKLKYLYSKARKELMIISSIPLIFIFIYADRIMSVFNVESNQNVILLVVFSITQFICLSTGTTGVFLNIVNKERALRLNTTIGLLLTLICCLFMPIIGIYGMLIGYSIGVLFENIASYFSVKKVLDEKK